MKNAKFYLKIKKNQDRYFVNLTFRKKCMSKTFTNVESFIFKQFLKFIKIELF
jgi:hypothetical protein